MRATWRLLFGVLLAWTVTGAATAAGQAAAPALDPKAVGAWMDSYFGGVMAKTHIPGAILVVVDHGRIVVLKGYGVTGIGGKTIDPQTTLFRLGSITKTLTAIAATQMIGEHRIDPAEDVNRDLTQIQVPDRFGPVTIGNLLLHEGGFGAELRGVDAPTNRGADISPAEMQRLLVPRVRPPGAYMAYDNNGWGVLGLALANVSHESYRDLIDRRIFRPLGMTHAVIGVPDSRMATVIEEHYVMPDGTVRRIPHQLLKPMEQGAGDASATGADMARYMTALLQGGRIDGKRILTPAQFAALTDFDAHRIHPMLPGYGRAFYEDREAGHDAIRHDGGMAGSASSMVLYPAEQVGVFFAINARPFNPFDGETLTGVATGIRMFLFDPRPKVSLDDFLRLLKIHEAFARKFLPPAPPEAVRTQGIHRLSDAEIAALAGTYVSTPSQFASFVGNLQVRLIEGLAVAPAGHGDMRIGGKLYRQIQPGLFEDPQTHLREAFRVTRYGAFMGPAALWIMRRVAWYDTPLLVVLPLILLPLFLLFAAFYGLGRNPVYRRLGVVAASLALVYAVCLFCEGQYATYAVVANRMWLAFVWRAILQLAILGLALWPVLLLLRWRTAPPARTGGGIAAALHFGLMALCSWALVLLAGYWNLLGRL
ncbi:MAG: serine hydrolase domain-containing protein [Rhizomicrobium sp.]